MKERKSKILQIAPLLLKINHYMSTNQPVNLEKEHSSLKYNQKLTYQNHIENLDHILQFLNKTETMIKEQIQYHEKNDEYICDQVREKLDYIKKGIKLLKAKK